MVSAVETAPRPLAAVGVNGARKVSQAAPPPLPYRDGLAALGVPARSEQMLRQVATVSHQGVAIVFAREVGGTALYYDVLDLAVTGAADDQQWSGFTKLALPEQLRSAGLGLVTIEDPKGAILADADAPLTVVSDAKYVHVFQQSTRNTVLLNRFILKRVAPPGGGATMPVLEPVWEVRFKRSGKQDVPDGPRDTQGYVSPDGTPFIEPTIELEMVRGVDKGRFDVLLLPNEAGSAMRWQIFAVNSTTGRLDLFSFPMDESGLFDLTGAELDAGGNVKPDVSVALKLNSAGLPLAGMPSATLYTLRERVRSTGGDELLLKRTARVLVSVPVQRSTLEVATLDFALAKDGSLARIAADTAVSPVKPADYALQFTADAYLGLPASGSLEFKGSFRAEFWLFLQSAATDGFVVRGDASVPPVQAAPYVKVTRDLRIEVGFGTGTAAVTAQTAHAVVAPSTWIHAEIAYDATAPSGNFSVRINGDAVPVTGADVRATPAGKPLKAVGEGLAAILDGLALWNGSTAAGDWRFAEVDYAATPPTTPDSSPAHNDATVHGAILVPSTAPTSSDTDGTLQIDERGLTVYGGLLDFARPAASPFITTGSDGLVHLFYEGDDHLFTVAQYDAVSSRAVYGALWSATGTSSTETGTLEFVAARSGTFMNAAAIVIAPAAETDLCDVTIDDGRGRSERWKGMPRALDEFCAVLNGGSTEDVADVAFRAGGATFYDNAGTYAMSRLDVAMPAGPSHVTLLSRFPRQLPLESVRATGARSLVLTLKSPQWNATITQTWPNLPPAANALLPVLAGVSDSYDYTPTDSATASVHPLPAGDQAGAIHRILILVRELGAELTVAITPGTAPDRCTIDLALDADRKVHFNDIRRDQTEVTRAINESTLATDVLAIDDGLAANVADRASAPLPAADMRAWATIAVAFADRQLTADATLPAQGPVAAKTLQQSTLTVDGTEAPLHGPSTMFRASPESTPSNGGTASVQDTAGFTNGTANLLVGAVNGGWARRSPDKAIAFDGSDGVIWDQAAAPAEVLAIPGDLTTEAWLRPAIIADGAARPRLLTYHRRGSVDYPDELIRHALGLHPAPSLRFGASTAVTGAYNLKTPDCTLQLWLEPTSIEEGRVMRLTTIGVAKAYVTVSVDGTGRVVAEYADGQTQVTSKRALKAGTWTQVTATLAANDPQAPTTVELRLYLDGKLDGSASGKAVSFSQPPGSFSLGSTSGSLPMAANGAFMWRWALDADQVARTYGTTVPTDDPGLGIAWYLTEGTGSTLVNEAVDGVPLSSQILNQPPDPWPKAGIYALPFALNRGYGLLARSTRLSGGWAHLAAAYRTAYALHLPGDQYADCGDDASLDFDSTFSLEAWITPERTGTVQTLISKPGNYELGLDYDDRIVLTVWTTDGVKRLTSDAKVTRDTPAYLAATVRSGATEKAPSDKQVPPTYFLDIRLYLNGALVKSSAKDDYADPVSIATSTARLSLARSTAGAAYFAGYLADVRLWNRALPEATILGTFRTHRSGSADGLVSYWRFSEGRGKVAYDATNLNLARLTSNALWSLYAPAASLQLVVDGEEVAADVIDPASVGGYGAEQFTVASSANAGTPYAGELNDLRIWRVERTAEQIRDDMYRELTGAEPGLAGYWPFDAGSGLLADDATGHGNAGTLSPPNDPPRWIDSRAPLSNEAKEVVNALGGLRTEYVIRISGTPSVAEYSDTNRDAYGGLFSVMKRCYVADTARGPDLIPGYKVGDLDTVYAGQVQTSPSLVGFIEGAPPLPSENQTTPYWSGVTELNAYAGASTVRLQQAEQTTRAFSGGEKTGETSSLSGKVGLYLSTTLGQSVGIGSEVDWQIFTIEGHLGGASESHSGAQPGKELGFGVGKTTTTIDELSAGGSWEPADALLNPAVGRRYVPSNAGLAIVKSLTADMYLVMLRGSNAVVKTTLIPNADIPEDVNLIAFPIDPSYTKNGTLDGMVGFTPDPSFPFAQLEPSSYFRPLQAYSMKRAIERQDQQLEAYYAQYDTGDLSAIPSGTTVSGGEVTPATGFTKLRDEILPAEPGYDWRRRLARRSAVNTYVWSASGGLHTEQSELVDTYSEQYSGVSSWDSSGGLVFDLAAAFTAGFYAEFDSLAGVTLEVESIKQKDSSSSYGLDVAFSPERFLKRPVLDGQGEPLGYTADDAPGKVDGYRFMSFALPPSERNFESFQTVVDRQWLTQSADPGAAALRTATGEANGAWRVLHRVTYVSRVPPPLQPTPAETAPEDLEPPANLESNTVLTRLVERELPNRAPTPGQIGAAIAAVLGSSPASPGKLAQVLPWWIAFLTAAADTRSAAYRTLADLRVDLLQYMIQKEAAR